MSSSSSEPGASLPARCADVLPDRPLRARRRRLAGRVPTPSRRMGGAMLAAFTLGLLPGALVGLAPSVVASVPAATIEAYAGTGSSGSAGDGGQATLAQLAAPLTVAQGPDDSVYVADPGAGRIRRILADGVITTFAGNGGAFASGDGGSALDAQVGSVYGLAVDGAGHVYFSDIGADVVRRVDAVTGQVSHVAGRYFLPGLSGDSGQATSAQLNNPYGLAMTASGHLLIADADNSRVRKVDLTTGVITTVAGTQAPNGNQDTSGNGGPATSAKLELPISVTDDGAGGFYLADAGDHRVRRVNSAGTISHVAGTGTAGTAGNDGPARSASLSTPAGMAVGGGSLFVAEYGSHRVRRISSTGMISTLAGTGSPSSSGNGGPALSATLSQPYGVVLSSDGDLLTSEIGAHVVRRITPVVAPAPPVLTATSPSSEGSTTDPRVLGTAPRRTTVQLHTDAACTSAVVGGGTADQLAGAGIAASVPADTTTTLWATTTSTGGAVSPCSTTAVTYTADTLPPDPPVLTAEPASPSAGTSPQWAFTATGSAATTCSLTRDETVVRAEAPCTSPVPYVLADQPDGDYVLTVTATDEVGNTSAGTSFTAYRLDRQGPAAPSIAQVTTGSTSATPTWQVTAEASATLSCRLTDTSGVDIAGYGPAPCTATVTYDLTQKPYQPYVLRVRAIDVAGNGGTEAASAAYDYVDPVVNAPAIQTGPGVTGRDPVLTWTFSPPSDFTPLCSVSPGTASTPVACSSSYTFTAPADGTYTFTVQNEHGSASATHVLDRQAPAAPVIAASPAAGASPTVAWSFTGESPGFQCAVVSGTAAPPGSAYLPCASPSSHTLSTERVHSFWVRTVDAAGNEGAPASRTYDYDTQAPLLPTVTALQDPTGRTASASWSFDVTDDDMLTWRCRLTRGDPATTVMSAYAPCASAVTYALEDVDDLYTLSVTATDPAGNRSAAGSSTYRLDTRAPDAPLVTRTSPTSRLGNELTPTWSLTVEAGATLRCELHRGGAPLVPAATCSGTYASVLDGTQGVYALQVTAVDAAGNVSAPSSSEYELDTTPPSVAVTAGQRSPGTTRTLSWSFPADPDDTAECRLTGPGATAAAWEACATSYVLAAGDPAGTYTFQARLIDGAGNVGAAVEDEYELLAAVASPSPTPPSLSPSPSPTTSVPSPVPSPLPSATPPPAPAPAPPVEPAPGASPSASPSSTPSPSRSASRSPSPSASPSASATATPSRTVAPTSSASPPAPSPSTAVPPAVPTPSPSTTDAAPPAPAPAPAPAPVTAPSSPSSSPPTPPPSPPSAPARTSAPDAGSALRPDGSLVTPVRERAPQTTSARTSSPSPAGDGPAAAGATPRPTPGSTTPPSGPGAGAATPAVDEVDDTIVLSAVSERAGEVGAVLADAAQAVLGALAPASLVDAAEAVGGFVRDLDGEQVVHAAQVAAPKTAFPMGLVLMVVGFLTMQNRIDRNDPKLALAPVYADRHLDFSPPRPPTFPDRGAR